MLTGEGVPLYALCSVNGTATSDENILEECEVVENNDNLLEKVASTSMSNVTHGTIPSDTGYGRQAAIWLYFDKFETKKLIVLFLLLFTLFLCFYNCITASDVYFHYYKISYFY